MFSPAMQGAFGADDGLLGFANRWGAGISGGINAAGNTLTGLNTVADQKRRWDEQPGASMLGLQRQTNEIYDAGSTNMDRQREMFISQCDLNGWQTPECQAALNTSMAREYQTRTQGQPQMSMDPSTSASRMRGYLGLG
jgi:hypothetical protein